MRSLKRGLIFAYCDANFALPETFSLVTAVRFLNGQEAFPLTTAAQNMCNLCRKSPLCRKHFFGWLKTANISIVCGTVTLKSLLPQAFAVSNVHPRPRKRPPRCTLDCGFKTSESPALRGFVAERCPITGTSFYLVLKSNGPHRSKNFPHKRPTFAFAGESGYTLAFAQRIAHKGTHAEAGAFSPLATVRLCAASEISFIPPRFCIHTFPGSL